MGEMKNLQPGDRGYKFLKILDESNKTLQRKEQKLWSMMPIEIYTDKDRYNWFYNNRYLLWYIDDDCNVYPIPVHTMKGLWFWDLK